MQALTNQELTVYGEGLQTRSFCYVSDTVRGLIALMNSGETGPVNIGNPSEYTMVDMAKKIINLTGSSSGIIHLPAIADDPNQRRPDISLANTLLDWRPEIDIDQGLLKTIDYFKEQL